MKRKIIGIVLTALTSLLSIITFTNSKSVEISEAKENYNAYKVYAVASWLGFKPTNPYVAEFHIYDKDNNEYPLNKNIYTDLKVEDTVICDFETFTCPKSFTYSLLEKGANITKTHQFEIHIYYQDKEIYKYVKNDIPNLSYSKTIDVETYTYTFDDQFLEDKTDVPITFDIPKGQSLPKLFNNIFKTSDGNITFTNKINVPSYINDSSFAGIYAELNGTYVPYYDSDLNPISYSSSSNVNLNKDTTLIFMFKYPLNLITSGGYIPIDINYYLYGVNYPLPKPLIDGYVCSGWYLSSDLSGNHIRQINKGVKEELTLYAGYELASYNVYLDAEGGILQDDELIINYESDYQLPIPIKQGYEFISWTLEGNNIPLSGTWDYETHGRSSFITLVAAYKQTSFEVNYYVDNKIYKTSFYNENDKIDDIKEVVKKDDEIYHYYFLGWYLDLNDDEPFDFVNSNVTSDVNLYAKFDTKLIIEVNVENFINNYMHPEIEYYDQGSGLCISAGYYSLAKDKYNELSQDERNLFNSDYRYKSYKDRLNAWALASGDSIDESYLIQIKDELHTTAYNDGHPYVTATVIILSGMIIGLIIIKTRKEQR